ncbi:glycoside hydrolase family 31 protein [Bacteroides cellulosilyticus]|uniref:glycoside hydrolase family 31 protein n=1 Tax=Bacteroides cellulosilyticus TaxID=246787 RepID=UPI0039775CB4
MKTVWKKWNLVGLIAMTLSLSVFLLNAACVSSEKKNVVLELEQGTLSLIPLNRNAVRVQFAQSGSVPMQELIYTENSPVPEYEVAEDDKSLTLSLEGISVEFDKGTEALTFKDANKRIILQEKVGGRFMAASSVQGEATFQVEQHFVSPKDEYIYGTGQFQDGYLNIRGLSRRLTQVNTQISIPFILSNKGYGLLWNNYGLTDFNPADESIELTPASASGEAVTVNTTGTSGNVRETRQTYSFTASLEVPHSGRYSLLLDVGQRMARKYYLAIDGDKVFDINNLWLPPTTSAIVELSAGKHAIEVQGERNDKPVLYWRPVSEETVFRSPVAQTLDYTVFAGNGDEVIASYRELTGPSPMMPLWSLGYIHCRERYNTQAELLENAREFRQRKLPIDMIVQDWQYWGKHGWNAMRFDEDRYPDPGKMLQELHDMDIRLMISVWSKIDTQSEIGKQATENGYYIPGSDWIDFFNADAAAFYWQNFRNGLLKYGIDAWWQDATEPENDDLQNRRINNGQTPGEVYRNVYPMYVSKTIYEGLRKDDSDRRAMIFTRSGFSGMQRYAAATWSGDVGHDWETLRRQIAGGLGQMATGLPWWTYDAGGFFRPGDQYTNTGYHEQFIRWLQAGTFFPLMRVHGYMSNTEPWRYGEKVERIVARYLDLRYRLLPYIYSQNAAISFKGSTLMRPLVMDFPEDSRALEQKHQFMFGPSVLVAPVVEGGINRMKVYLPECPAGWIDFWNGASYKGGQMVDVDVDLEKIPLFVKAGSILPLGPTKQSTFEDTEEPWEIRIYPGANGTYSVYEDEGNNYNYEKGQFCTFDLNWNDTDRTLTISDRKGKFTGMKKKITFNVIMVSPQSGTGVYQSTPDRTVTYSGKSMVVSL